MLAGLQGANDEVVAVLSRFTACIDLGKSVSGMRFVEINVDRVRPRVGPIEWLQSDRLLKAGQNKVRADARRISPLEN